MSEPNDPASVPLVPAAMLHALTVAHAEIARLRLAIRRLAEQDATLSLLCKRDGSQVVTVTIDGTLTDAEREALHHAVGDVADLTGPVEDTLRGLLERMK